MTARLEVELGTRTRTRTLEHRPGRGPFRILVLGDFSGRENRGALEHGAGLAGRPTVGIDVDTLEDALFRFSPALRLPVADAAGPSMELQFRKLDDFHPDELFERLELFRKLRDTRARLLDPAEFPRAAAELVRDATVPEAPAAEPGESEPEADADTLARLLGKRTDEAPPPTRAAPAGPAAIESLLREIVAPHVVPAPDPQQDQLVSAVDAAIADRMRAVLRHPSFRGLETGWRALHWLVGNVETDEELGVWILDVSKEELAADLESAGDDPRSSGLYSAVVEQGGGADGRPWSLIVGSFTFGPSHADTQLLAGLGAVAEAAGGPLIAAASGSALDDEEPESARRWDELRRSSQARWLGLAMPRLLLRLPYGAATDEIDRFAFEEIASTDDHEAWTWANPAFGCARLLAESFRDAGWKMTPGDRLEIDDLPAHVYEDGGERKLKPCAETLLSERAAEAILERGVMPLVSYRDRNAARLLRFQSLASPPAALAGPWDQSNV